MVETADDALPVVPAAGSSAAVRASDAPVATTNFVRVDLVRLDDLMRLVGDLVVSRARLEDALLRVERFTPAAEWRTLQEHSESIERHLRDLREGVMRVRLVPVGEIFRRMPFVVRDLARDNGKRIELALAGQGTEIDKFLIERMMDPILHLVRNAVSHGIEPPDERVAAGKRPEGTLRLTASTVGESVMLEVSDDGRGMDSVAIAQRARENGIDIPTAPDPASCSTICAAGYNARRSRSRQRRGVGMAVVRDTIRNWRLASLDTASARRRSARPAADARDHRCADRPRRRPRAAVRKRRCAKWLASTSGVRVSKQRLIGPSRRAPVVHLARSFDRGMFAATCT